MVQVLIADDDGITRSVLRTILEDAGHEVTGEASNGEEVISLCANQSADLVFLDINMPGMDGFAALEALRAAHPSLAIVMVSASSTLDNVRRAARFGVNGFVVKPFTPDKVLSCMKSIRR